MSDTTTPTPQPEPVNAEAPRVTGTPEGHLMQDVSRDLTRWLANKPDAMLHAREAAAAIGAQVLHEPVNAQMLAALREARISLGLMLSYHGPIGEPADAAQYRSDNAMDTIEEAIAAAEAAQDQPDPWYRRWRDAVDDELSCIHSAVESYATPREAVRALIDWHCAVQLDPAVSSAAQALIEQGRKEAQAQPAAVPTPFSAKRVAHLVSCLRDNSGGHINGLYDREAADMLEELAQLADSEGTRAVQYLRRARKAEAALSAQPVAQAQPAAVPVARTPLPYGAEIDYEGVQAKVTLDHGGPTLQVLVDGNPETWEWECQGIACRVVSLPAQPAAAVPAPAVPKGWKLVPVELTREMIDAAGLGCSSGEMRGAWKDMLAAAPADPLAQPQQGGEA